MSEPTTETGRELVGVLQDEPDERAVKRYIVRVERQAAAKERARLEVAVKSLTVYPGLKHKRIVLDRADVLGVFVPSERSIGMNRAVFDWDNASVKLMVPVDNGTTVERQEMELPLRSFAGLLLTNAPSSWFAQPPVSDDLPLAIEFPPIDEVEAKVRRASE